MAWIEEAATGMSCQLRSRSSLSPWNSPASTIRRAPFDSTRYFEPVTVRAAPRNVTRIISDLEAEDCSPAARGESLTAFDERCIPGAALLLSQLQPVFSVVA